MEDLPAGGFVDIGRSVFQSGWGAGANGDKGSFTGEFLCNGTAESFAGSRDDSDAAYETQIQSCTPSKTLIVSRNGEVRQQWEFLSSERVAPMTVARIRIEKTLRTLYVYRRRQGVVHCRIWIP